MKLFLFVIALACADPSMTSELVTQKGLLPNCAAEVKKRDTNSLDRLNDRSILLLCCHGYILVSYFLFFFFLKKGLNVCHFTLHSEDTMVASIGCDLKLFSEFPPYQDPAGDNFAPPAFPNTTSCDSFLSARDGRLSIMTEVSFIQWGGTSPFVVSAVLILRGEKFILPNSDTLLLQLAFPGKINETVVKGTFFIIGPGSVYWSAPVECGQEKRTVSLVTSQSPPVTTLPQPGLSGGSIAGVVIGLLLALALAGLVLVVLVRFCRRKKKVQRTFDGLDIELQEDFQAVARAALRE